MNRPAVFFDRDNTLIANDGYLGDPAKTVLIPGAADAIARARALGYAVVTISNQSGVARGLFGEDAVRAVNARMDELLRAQNPGAIVDRHEFCPFHPQAAIEKYRLDSPLRKPAPGMLLAAAEAMALDLPKSWLIGDAPRDIAAGKAAGCRTVLFHDPGLPASPAADANAVANGNVAPDHTAATLGEAMAFIERQTPPPAPPPAPAPVASKPTITKPTATRTAALATPLSARKPPGAAPMAAQPATPPTAAPAAPAKVAAKPAAPPTPPPVTRPESLPAASSRLETLAEQILIELRRGGEMAPDDFSVSKLLAGLLQVIVLAVLFLGYVQVRTDIAWLQIYVLVALTFQTMTIALLIMSRQK